MRHFFRRLPVLLIAVALVAAACGDDDTAPTTIADPGTTAATGTTAAAETTGATGTTEGDDGDAATTGDVDELFATFQMTPLRLTYSFTSNGEADIIIVSQDPTQDPPVAAFFDDATSIKFIQDGDQFIACTPDCFALPAGTAGGGEFLTGLMGPLVGLMATAEDLAEIPGVAVTEETATVAGREGICFTFSGAGSTGRTCIDNELGFMLTVEEEDPATGNMELVAELVEFDEPQPGDFEPLGPVTDTPDYSGY